MFDSIRMQVIPLVALQCKWCKIDATANVYFVQSRTIVRQVFMPVIEEFQPGSIVVMVINNTGLELALDINTLVVNTVIIARKKFLFSHCMLTPDAALHAIFHVHVCETQLHPQGRRCM